MGSGSWLPSTLDWRSVWIKTLEGEFLGVAELVSATGYRAKTQTEIAEEKRANAQLKRNAHKAKQIVARTRDHDCRGAQRADRHRRARHIVHGRLAQSKQPQALPRRADETVIEVGEIVQPAPHQLSRTDRPVAENYTEWLDLQARQAWRGEALSAIDAKFITSWPNVSQGKAWFKYQARQAGGEQ